MTQSGDRRVFLEIKDASALVRDLEPEHGRGFFVPTRLPLALNNIFILALRFAGVSREMELPMLVVGRRPPKSGGSMLSGGVVAKLADPDNAMFALLREVAAGRVGDLEARIQQQHRIPAVARFATTADAVGELRVLLEDGGTAQVPVETPVARGDRLAVTVVSDDEGTLVVVPAVVKSVGIQDGHRLAGVVLFDEKGRAAVQQLLQARSPESQQQQRRA